MFRVPLLFILLVVPTVTLRIGQGDEFWPFDSATPALCDCTACRTNFQTELGAVKDRIQSNYPRSFFDTVAMSLEGPSKGCKLRSVMQNWLGGRNITIAVSGSSPTAGAGGVFGEDRYISQFESEVQSWKGFVRNDGPSEGGVGAVNFHTAAQGGMTTLWAGHLLDLAVGDADVLIWEYTLTDHYWHTIMPDGDFDNSLALKYFLQKAMALPSKPAVILMYLWDSYTWPLGRTIESSHADVLKQYADKGLDISVIYAAEAARQHAEQQGLDSSSETFKKMIWADENDHHPGQLVHNMLRDGLTNLFATAGLDACSLAQTCKHDSLEPFGWDAAEQAQAGDLVASFTSRRSLPLTHWQPLFGTPKIELLHDMGRVPELEPGAIANPLRMDRKYGIPIFPCVQSKRMLMFKARSSQITTRDKPASLLVAFDGFDMEKAEGMMNFRINSKQFRRPILKDQCIRFTEACILTFELTPLDVPDDQMPEVSMCLEQDDAKMQARFGEEGDIRDHMFAAWVVLHL